MSGARAPASPVVHIRIRRHGECEFRLFVCVWFRDAKRKQACKRAMAGGRWDGKSGWVVSADKVHTIVRRLRAEGFNVGVDPDALAAFETREVERVHDESLVRERLRRLDEEFRRSGRSLYPFQMSGAIWLTQRDRALLADDQGLGKTVQIIAALPSEAPVVVVCPASLKGNWAREFLSWRPGFRVAVLSGRDAFRWPRPGEAVILNYDILPEPHGDVCPDKAIEEAEDPFMAAIVQPERPPCRGCASYLATAPDKCVVVVDEAHNLRTKGTRRGERFRVLAEEARKKHGRTWLATGTPLVNRPDELWNVYEAADLAREAFGSYTEFLRLFGGKVKKLGNGRFAGVSWGRPLPEVAERIAAVTLRRMKRDVLTELPPREWRTVTVDVGPRDLAYIDEAIQSAGLSADAVVRAIEEGKEAVISKMSAARSALAAAKTRALVDYVRDEFEAVGEPVVVFSAHRPPIDHLGKRDGWAAISGDVSSKRRTEIVERFQAGELKGLALTIGAGSEGLTLTRAWNMVYVDRAWTPAANAQAADRIYRIGQRAPRVIYTDLVTSHPLDRRVTEVLVKKARLIEETVDAAAEKQAS